MTFRLMLVYGYAVLYNTILLYARRLEKSPVKFVCPKMEPRF